MVAPATYNTINKWAQGISDTYALGVLAETTGLGTPIVVLPVRQLRTGQPRPVPPQRRIAAQRRRAASCSAPAAFEPHPPRTGGALIDSYPWHLALDEAERMLDPTTQKP